MAGAHEPFTFQPYFFPDLCEFGYEATSEVDSRLVASPTGRRKAAPVSICCLRNGMVSGVMMCNVLEKV